MTLLQRIRRTGLEKRAEQPGPGWHTIEWFSKSEGISTQRAGQLLRSGVNLGVLEQKKFSVISAGKLLRVLHFREIKSPKAAKHSRAR